jgi:solute carrier family 25 (adenine nucleotide translocator) protein 4/5/6/31
MSVSSAPASPDPVKRVSDKSAAQKALTSFLIGTGIVAPIVTIFAPLERVRLLLQTHCSNEVVLRKEMKPFNSAWHCAMRIRSDQGLQSFWRGNVSEILRQVTKKMSAIAFDDMIKGMLPAKTDNPLAAWNVTILRGGVSAALATVLSYPFDLARTKLASDIQKGPARFRGIVDCWSATVRGSGYSGLYTGFSAAFVGGFVHSGSKIVHIGLYRHIKEQLPKRDGMHGAFDMLGVSIAAGLVTFAIHYPFDTICRRMMLQSEKPTKKKKRKKKYVLGCLFIERFVSHMFLKSVAVLALAVCFAFILSPKRENPSSLIVLTAEPEFPLRILLECLTPVVSSNGTVTFNVSLINALSSPTKVVRPYLKGMQLGARSLWELRFVKGEQIPIFNRTFGIIHNGTLYPSVFASKQNPCWHFWMGGGDYAEKMQEELLGVCWCASEGLECFFFFCVNKIIYYSN